MRLERLWLHLRQGITDGKRYHLRCFLISGDSMPGDLTDFNPYDNTICLASNGNMFYVSRDDVIGAWVKEIKP